MNNMITFYHASDRKQGDIYMLQILDEEMKADDPRIR